MPWSRLIALIEPHYPKGKTSGKRRQLDLTNCLDAIYNQIERLKAGVRTKVEHPLRVLKQQFGYTKTRYRGLVKVLSR